MSTVTFYREQDADPAALTGECVAVIGYGNLGRSMALNLRDSGLKVVVGNIDDPYRRVAADDGFEVLDIADAVEAAQLVYILTPDEALPSCFAADMRPHLRPGQALAFASGYALAFGLLDLPAGIDVLLLAPRMLGEEVRRSYLEGGGFFGYISVEQDASGRALDRLLGLAAAPGGLGKDMSGEMARTFQAFAEVGFMQSVGWHGAVAQYGGFIRTLEVDRDAMQRMFSSTLEDIRNGGVRPRAPGGHTA